MFSVAATAQDFSLASKHGIYRDDADHLDRAIHKAVIKRNKERSFNPWGNQQGVA